MVSQPWSQAASICMTVDATFIVGSPVGTPGRISPPISLLPLPDGSGDLYVGGNIATYNGISVGHIVRLNSNGTLDSGSE